jgi:hypothetical protein
MIIIERQVQQIFPNKWVELDVLDKKYDVVEKRLGFPPKKRMQVLSGGLPMNTVIIERQWPSLAAMEATYEKAMQDPEDQALQAESAGIIQSNHWELYMPMP